MGHRQFLLLLLVITIPCTVSATILDVPNSYPTIQSAINASANEDTVLVQPGTYFENIDFGEHSIVLASLFLTTGDEAHVTSTIIDGNSAGSVVTVEFWNSTNLIVGLTLRNGAAAIGGGLHFAGSNITLQNLVVTGNQATVMGGGLGLEALFTAEVAVIDCLIENNTSLGPGGGVYAWRAIYGGMVFSGCVLDGNSAAGKGGGMYSDATMTVTNCNFTNNSLSALNNEALGGGFHGGLRVSILEECLFSGNSADFGGGLGFYNSTPATSVNACTMVENTGLGGGGGIWFDNRSGLANNNGSVTGCTIQDNQTIGFGGGIGIPQGTDILVNDCVIATNSGGIGGGIFVNDADDVRIENCTVVGNEASSHGGGALVNGGCTITNSIVTGNTASSVGGIVFATGGGFQFGDIMGNLPTDFEGAPGGFGDLVNVNANGDPCDVYGNIALDPIFCGEDEGNFKYAQESPCCGAGQDGVDIGALGPGCSISAVGDPMPRPIVLMQNVPNPFNPSTNLSFDLAAAGHVRLKVFDTIGHLVRTLVDEDFFEGRHDVIWNGRDSSGRLSAAGVYLYRLEVGNYSESKRMVLIK